MFFLIGGLQPKTRKIDGEPNMTCPSCSRPTLELRRTDQYLSLFFIPLFPVKKGRPHRFCTACGTVADRNGRTAIPGTSGGARICRACGRAVQGDFFYCPYCGRPLNEVPPS